MFTACIDSDCTGFASNCSMLLAYDLLNSLNTTLNVFSFPSYNLAVALKISCQIFALELLFSIMIEILATRSHSLFVVLLPSFGGPFFLIIFLRKDAIAYLKTSIFFFPLLFCLIPNLTATDF